MRQRNVEMRDLNEGLGDSDEKDVIRAGIAFGPIRVLRRFKELI